MIQTYSKTQTPKPIYNGHPKVSSGFLETKVNQTKKHVNLCFTIIRRKQG